MIVEPAENAVSHHIAPGEFQTGARDVTFHSVSKGEVEERWLLLNTENVLGAVWSPSHCSEMGGRIFRALFSNLERGFTTFDELLYFMMRASCRKGHRFSAQYDTGQFRPQRREVYEVRRA
jgi:hypothetical protein